MARFRRCGLPNDPISPEQYRQIERVHEEATDATGKVNARAFALGVYNVLDATHPELAARMRRFVQEGVPLGEEPELRVDTKLRWCEHCGLNHLRRLPGCPARDTPGEMSDDYNSCFA